MILQQYGLRKIVRYAFPIIRKTHLFAADLEKDNIAPPFDLPSEYQPLFPCDGSVPVSSLRLLGIDEPAYQARRNAGDMLGVVMKGENAVHRSFVQTRGHVGIPGDRRAFALGQGEVYVHFCETAASERGKKLYPAMLRIILSRLPDFKVKMAFICCEQSNIASIRGVLNAGFRYEKSAVGISVLWGRVHHSVWYQSRDGALKGLNA